MYADLSRRRGGLFPLRLGRGATGWVPIRRYLMGQWGFAPYPLDSKGWGHPGERIVAPGRVGQRRRRRSGNSEKVWTLFEIVTKVLDNAWFLPYIAAVVFKRVRGAPCHQSGSPFVGVTEYIELIGGGRSHLGKLRQMWRWGLTSN